MVQYETVSHEHYLANSTSDAVACGALSFLSNRTFLGGEGHCRERRS